VAGLAGVILMLCSVAVVVALGLPDASDVATLTDFAKLVLVVGTLGGRCWSGPWSVPPS
jgi:hypothetical protein